MEQMTLEQAIQEIQTYMYSDCYLDAPSNDACKLAISALEKQVPKNRKRVGMSAYCNICGSILFMWCHSGYCGKCGQAIDWSE